jgi:hypothetical protein
MNSHMSLEEVNGPSRNWAYPAAKVKTRSSSVAVPRNPRIQFQRLSSRRTLSNAVRGSSLMPSPYWGLAREFSRDALRIREAESPWRSR